MKTTRFDAADFLDTPELQLEYINIALESGDADNIRRAINAVARARGMAKVAEVSDIGREGLYRALGESGNPEFATMIKVIGALGINLRGSYAPVTKRRPKRPAPKKTNTNRKRSVFEKLRGHAGPGLSTDEIMAMLRGDADDDSVASLKSPSRKSSAPGPSPSGRRASRASR